MIVKTLILIILSAFWTGLCHAGSTEDDSEALYRQAEENYNEHEYEKAKNLLEDALVASPDVSRYHHLLGKCYGRLAEQAGAFRALSLARKTRRHFEKAVELDDENLPALRDLMKYYQQAPGFLGGSRKKADEISKKISRINDATVREQQPFFSRQGI